MSFPLLPPSRILIVGAGPSGLVSYRNLTAHGKFINVTLYERRDDVGGVWYLDKPLEDPNPGESTNFKSPRWPSPAYPGLIGNVLPEYLSFSQFPFPTGKDPNQPFPTLVETHNFLRMFAEPSIQMGKIQLNIEVTHIEEQGDGRWGVEVRDWNKGGELRVEEWDAVVLAVGWYDNPTWPNTPGLAVLRENGLTKHAKWYQGPQGLEGKRVLVVGNANSGNDICAHLAPIAETPVYQSIRRPAFPKFPSLPDDRIRMVAPVSRFELSMTPHSDAADSHSPEKCDAIDKINAHLQDGTTLTDIDFVHIATGYEPYPDFVHVLNPDIRSPSNTRDDDHRNKSIMRLVDQNPHPESGTRVPSLHRHILYAYNPTLAFIGSPLSLTPFTVNDVSSLWLSLVWSHTIPLLNSPPTPFATLTEKLLQFEKDRLEMIRNWRENVGNPSALYSYGVLGASEEEYANGLRKEIVDVIPEADRWFEIKWAPEEERRKWRERMYPMKFEALKYARDHAKI